MSEEEIRKIFSRNLTYYLGINGKNQKDLVEYMKVSSSTASNWCTGQKLPRMDKIQSISNWLGIQNSDLLEVKSNTINNTYQIDGELNDLLLFIQENPEYKAVFEATKSIQKEDLPFVIQMLERLHK